MEISPQLLERIRGEFLEMPGLKLTTAQACRLWNLKEERCREALDTLIAEGFLLRTPSGAFIALPSAVKIVKASIFDDGQPMRCPHCRHLNAIPATNSILLRPGPTTTFRCAACSRIVNVASASA
jgi:hypothetical protein